MAASMAQSWTPPAQPQGRPISIVTEDGSLIDISKMDLPESLKQILTELDVDNSGQVTEQNVRDSLSVFKQLKKGLDADGSGSVTHKEMEDGVSLLTRLLASMRSNAAEMEYTHLPECIQEVMREWDTDNSGKVGASEIGAAARAYKKIQEEGRMMKKIILALTVVILFLMAGMFVMSYAAVESTKEMRGKEDGVMQTPSGAIIKVASSDFEMGADGSLIIRGSTSVAPSCPVNQTCRRLGSNNGGGNGNNGGGNGNNGGGNGKPLQVAQSEAPRQLTSTLPDDAFKELKSLTLKDNSNRALKVSISGFQRLSLRSSRCGSVIHLFSPNGRLTLDDYEMTADEAMEKYVQDAGMGGLFESGASGWGRRLSSTDGMLEGFFNLLNDVEWACESVELPSPDNLPQYYHATIKVRHLHENPAKAFSYIFTDEDDMALELAGIEHGADGRLYKTWSEDLVKAGAYTAYRSVFLMAPFQSELRVKASGLQVRTEIMDGIGYRCFIDGVEASMISQMNSGAPPTMEFMGVVVEGGMVLRRWRMYTIDETGNGTDQTVENMVEAGMLPNIIDYYDVDTDPRGEFAPGQPRRVVMTSTVEGAKVYTEKEYTSITALPHMLSMQGVFDIFGVTKVDKACQIERKLVNDTNAQDLQWETTFLVETNRSLTDPNFKVPAPIQPWTELAKNVKYTYDKLLKARKSDPENPAIKLASKSRYWSLVLKLRHNREALDDQFSPPTPDPSNDVFWVNDTNETNETDMNETDETDMNETDAGDYEIGTSDPLGGRRLGTFVPGSEVGSYSGRIVASDLEARRRGKLRSEHEARRLSHERRLGAVAWVFEFEVTNERVHIKVEIGAASFEFKVHYCHLYAPTVTNWPACQTGRQGAGGVVKLESSASGAQVVFPYPHTTFTLGGFLVYDDTSALGCATGEPIRFAGLGTRGKNLEDRNGVVGMSSETGGWQKWTIIPATGGAASLLGQDARVWIKSHRGKCLGDYNGVVKVADTCQGWEKWRIMEGGNGVVYLQSHRGKYLGVSAIPANYKTCTITIYRDTGCKGSSKTYTTTNPDGQIWHFSDDNWESAKASGDCGVTEFFDEDEDEPNYEDNQWVTGTFSCVNFVNDIESDMSGLRIFAAKPTYPPWSGTMKLYDNQPFESKWSLFTNAGSPACSSGSPVLYGGVMIQKEVDIIGDFGIGFTTEIGAGSSIHPTYGPYISEVYGKGIIEFGPLQVYLYFGFYPQDPWDTKYKEWEMCTKVGYELDIIITFRDEWEIFCTDINI